MIEQMSQMLKEIGAEIRSEKMTWRKEPHAPFDFFTGKSEDWQVLVAVDGDHRVGTATSTKRLVVVHLTDALARAAEERAKEVLTVVVHLTDALARAAEERAKEVLT